MTKRDVLRIENAFLTSHILMLKKGRQKDAILRITDLGEIDVPMVLESEELGIKLIADVQAPPAMDSRRLASKPKA